jgi:hypothetical protein
LKTHLVAAHFLSRLLTLVPARPPHTCPQSGCDFAAADPQQTAHHLGTSHSSVLLKLVRETMPRYDFTPELLLPPQAESDTVLLSDTSDEETCVEETELVILS